MSKDRHNHTDLLVYPTHMLTCLSSNHRHHNSKKPISNDHDGFMSYKAARRLRKAISWMHAISPDRWEKNPTTGKTFKMRLNFITLTLCAEQMHSDQEIKRDMLHPWITNMVKRFNLKMYAWRAEAQENGNIHFHFVTNKFMNLFVIRRAWNACQKRMGYIAKYRENQEAQHKGGFTPKPWLYKKWSKAKQEEAYKRGVANNWSDPNSTDVHAMGNVKNAAAYIAAYMCKSITGTCPECKKKSYFSKLPDEQPKCKKCAVVLDLKEDRKIEGRLWFISQSLSNIKPLRIPYSGGIDAEVYVANGWKSEGIECSPYATLFLIRPDNIPSYAGTSIKEAYKKFCTDTYNRIENPQLFETANSPPFVSIQVVNYAKQSSLSFVNS